MEDKFIPVPATPLLLTRAQTEVFDFCVRTAARDYVPTPLMINDYMRALGYRRQARHTLNDKENKIRQYVLAHYGFKTDDRTGRYYK